MLMMKDQNGHTQRVHKDDPRVKSGVLVGHTVGILMMKDKNGKIHRVNKDDSRIKSGELVGHTKGSTQTEDSNRKRSQALIGIPKPQKQEKCIFCRIKAVITNIHRWHNNNCPFKNKKNPKLERLKVGKLSTYSRNRYFKNLRFQNKNKRKTELT